eukprot:643880-Lingulodinium_polyedra.AAC.1
MSHTLTIGPGSPDTWDESPAGEALCPLSESELTEPVGLAAIGRPAMPPSSSESTGDGGVSPGPSRPSGGGGPTRH